MILKARYNGWFKNSTDKIWFVAPVRLRNGDITRAAFGGWMDIEAARNSNALPVKIVAAGWSEDGLKWVFIVENKQFVQGAYFAARNEVFGVLVNGLPRII